MTAKNDSLTAQNALDQTGPAGASTPQSGPNHNGSVEDHVMADSQVTPHAGARQDFTPAPSRDDLAPISDDAPQLAAEVLASHAALAAKDAEIARLTGEKDRVREEVLDAANAYISDQYGIGALGHPIDRGRILARLDQPKAESGE